jgi:RHS repeat-associated protein
LWRDWALLYEIKENNLSYRTYWWGLDLSGTRGGAGGVGGLVRYADYTSDANGVNYFVAQDGNGNVQGLVRPESGRTDAEYEYGPFGEVVRSEGPAAAGNPMRFSTKFQDDETGMSYYGYRYYNPSIGRWLTYDLLPSAEWTQGPNLYAFCVNQSVGRFDVNGLWYTDDQPVNPNLITIKWMGGKAVPSIPEKVNSNSLSR